MKNQKIHLVDKKMCTGCCACLNVCPQECIAMESDSEGFWYPHINTAECVNCGHCEACVSVIAKKVIEN